MKHNRRDDQHEFWDARDLQARIPLSRAGIYALLHHKNCPTIKLGKRLVVRQDEFYEFLESLKDWGE